MMLKESRKETMGRYEEWRKEVRAQRCFRMRVLAFSRKQEILTATKREWN